MGKKSLKLCLTHFSAVPWPSLSAYQKITNYWLLILNIRAAKRGTEFDDHV
jgi:hypothetical protein